MSEKTTLYVHIFIGTLLKWVNPFVELACHKIEVIETPEYFRTVDGSRSRLFCYKSRIHKPSHLNKLCLGPDWSTVFYSRKEDMRGFMNKLIERQDNYIHRVQQQIENIEKWKKTITADFNLYRKVPLITSSLFPQRKKQ